MSDPVIDPSTPILVGVHQITYRVTPEAMPTGLQMLEQAAHGALEDTGAGGSTRAAIDTVLAINSTIEEPFFDGMDLPKSKNPPLALARALGVPDARCIYTHTGGNTPQMVVNRLAEEIAGGKVGVALIAGAEFMQNFWALVQSGADMTAWRVEDDLCKEYWGDKRPGSSEVETAHAMDRPSNTYALIETAIRASRGSNVADHMTSIGKLMSPFTAVAAKNPNAWFPVERPADEIATETDKNRMVGSPYTKYMNSILRVDMSASLVLTSVGKARELGIPEEKWVYLRGCADGVDVWNISERPELHRSPAMAGCWAAASGMAGIGADELDLIDLYSCFPSAVEIACLEIGLAEDDSRGLTVTGGLPYFGGPGNNYATHSIAEMVTQLRAKPGAYGLCTANGWYITKHACGIYSTTPPSGKWSRENPSILQSELDASQTVSVTEAPNGRGTVETCTAVYGRDGPMFGLVIGRLEDNSRFVAQTATDEATINALRADDCVGRRGNVSPAGDGLKNIFTFE